MVLDGEIDGVLCTELTYMYNRANMHTNSLALPTHTHL